MMAKFDDVLELEERRAKKVALLSGLLRDPELAPFLSRLFGKRFNRVRAKTAEPQVTAIDGNNQLPRGLRDAIRAIGPHLPKPCTSDDVFQEIKRLGFVFHRANPGDAARAVRDAMWALSRGKGKVFERISEGRGGKLNKYMFRGQQSQTIKPA
jgi:hypothetical protein